MSSLQALALALLPSKLSWSTRALFKLFHLEAPWWTPLPAKYAASSLEKDLTSCWFVSYSPILEFVPLHFISAVLYLQLPSLKIMGWADCIVWTGVELVTLEEAVRSGFSEDFRTCCWSPRQLPLFKRGRKDPGTIRSFQQSFFYGNVKAKTFIQNWQSRHKLFRSKKCHQSEASLALLYRCNFLTLSNQLLTCLNPGIIALLLQRLPD